MLNHSPRSSFPVRIRPASVLLCLAAAAAMLLPGMASAQRDSGGVTGGREVVETYSELVYRNYRDAHRDAVAMQDAIEAFLADPNPSTLEWAKRSWLAARESYGTTEAFRFYEGPIDFANPETGESGPEGLLNAWPLNEAYIDYVEGNPGAGIVQQQDVPLTVELLVEKNAADDEANVTTGYHAIEFLLWGQDRSTAGPGHRPVSDYAGDGPVVQRRRQYLELATQRLVADLAFLVDAWAPDQANNYRASFVKLSPTEAIGHILTGLATLSGFELASERIGVPLDSGDQEDEHSCFSDNTHRDFVANVRGIANVYFGRYQGYRGPSLAALVDAADPALADQLEVQLHETTAIAAAIAAPVDRVLSSPAGSPGRRTLESLVTALQQQAVLLQQAGGKLGAKVIIAAE